MDNSVLIFDREGCLERLEGDEELLGELIEIYVDDAPNIFARLRVSLETGDIKAAEREAHSMKSASANVGAERVREVSRNAEAAARNGNSLEVQTLFEQMQEEFQKFCLLLT